MLDNMPGERQVEVSQEKKKTTSWNDFMIQHNSIEHTTNINTLNQRKKKSRLHIDIKITACNPENGPHNCVGDPNISSLVLDNHFPTK